MASNDRTAFDERLSLPWWSWPILLALAAGMAAEIGLGVPGILTWLPYAVLMPATIGGLIWASRLRVSVSEDQFTVDDASLPLDCVAAATPLTGTALRDALSTQLHPLAFVIQRPWVRAAVKIELNDPEDPTPYWIISTRRPEQLAAAVSGS